MVDPDEARWYLPAAELTKVPPAKVDEHLACQGFDNQEFYWHCYTHELYRQSF